jgi:hypothetical protein
MSAVLPVAMAAAVLCLMIVPLAMAEVVRRRARIEDAYLDGERSRVVPKAGA